MGIQTPLDHFLQLCKDEIRNRAAATQQNGDALGAGAEAFGKAREEAAALSPELTTVPVASLLPEISPATSLITAAQAAVEEIPWIPTPRKTDGGTEAALAPLNEVRDFGPVICGLLLLAPNGFYPLHSHPPQELYLPIADGGRWRYGGSEDFRTLEPDSLAYNNPNDLHAITAGQSPLLTMYVLWP